MASTGPPAAGSASPFDDPGFVAGLRPIPTGPLGEAEQRPAPDIVGEDLEARSLAVRIGTFDGPVLLCFLHVHCDGCEAFWRGLADDPPLAYPTSVAAVVVTKGPGVVDRAEVALAAGGDGSAASAGAGRVPVVMSNAAWVDYRVTGYPFFILVDPVPGTVIGEAVGFGWSDVGAMVRVALEARTD
jgi:hypothetical protein